MDYLSHILIMVGIYSILSMSLNIQVGLTGFVSISHAGFYGLGAYTAAILGSIYDLDLSLNFLISIFISSLVAFLVCFPSLRIKDDFYLISSLALQAVFFSIFNNWIKVTNGPMGITGIPSASLFGYNLDSNLEVLAFVTIICTFVFIFIKTLTSSPLGRIMKSIREDELIVESAGKSATKYKILASVLSGSIASIAGVLYAHYIGFIDPLSFTLQESIFILSIVIIGGAGSMSGPIIGAAILLLMPEIFRLIGIPSSVAASVRQILYGCVLVFFMIWRPQGLFGDYQLTKRQD